MMKTHMATLLENADFCTGKSSSSHFTRDWWKVTCKLCLRKRKMERRSPSGRTEEDLNRFIQAIKKVESGE